MASKSPTTHPWFEVCHPRPQAQYQVFIFPSAGQAGAYYRQWDTNFPEYEFAIMMYPGRGMRFGDKCLTTIKEYVEQLETGLLPFITKPCIFIGHSLGTAINFALAQSMVAKHNKDNYLKLMIQMGRGPPHLQDPDVPFYRMTDQQIIDTLKKTADASTRELYDFPDYMKMFLPMFRADSKVGSELLQATPVDIPIIVYGGEKEEIVDEAFLTRWKELTDNKDLFRVKMFPGHHQFQSQCQNEVLKELQEDFQRILNRSN